MSDINPKVQFNKIRNVKSPNRANAHDAGTDFFMPEYDQQFLEDLLIKNAANDLMYIPQVNKETGKVDSLEVIIPAGEQINIPSGIRVWINDKNTYLEAENKSGIASKSRLVVMAKVIDADYQGEIHINLANVGNSPVSVCTGQKLTQFIHRQYINTEWSEISGNEYKEIGVSDRGTGGFSSTGIY